ncbi:hypothetical protein GGI02_004498 [Coemansia sp. RSA 2322]|nr:hypothetical protein GGI02_004498 [Coemansia sp. RSA 2322]
MWLQRKIFSRKRGGSLADEATAQTAAETASIGSDSQRLDELERQLRLRYQHSEGDDSDTATEGEEEKGEEGEEARVSALLKEGNSAGGGAERLFARLSIAEIREYEQAVRRRTEAMRGQMRRVAGTHYRDLINAADSAVGMDAASSKASMRLGRLRAMLESTQAAPAPQHTATAAAGGEQDALRAGVYAVAAQVKVLVDTPEQIWRAMASRLFLQAALLYLIAGEMHRRLVGQSRGVRAAAAVDPLLGFPVIERQWIMVAPFGEQIAAKARQQLARAGSEAAAENAGLSAVCAIALLEDADGEMACAEFLALRTQALDPLLARLRAAQDPAGLEEALQELLGGVRQIHADYAAIFCGRAGGVRATLASICADSDQQPDQKSDQQPDQPRARHRRTPSVAGSLTMSPLGGGARAERGGGSAFMVAKFLPPEIAEFRPPPPRILDAGPVQHEGAARHAFALWWEDALAGLQDAAGAGIVRAACRLKDVARIGASLKQQHGGSGSLVGGSLYAAVVEPLLQRAARGLLCAAVDGALAQADAFVGAAGREADVLAGHLPWRELPRAAADGSVAELVADVRGSMGVAPAAVRALGDGVGGALRDAWRDGAAWWRLLGAEAESDGEAAESARYAAARWADMEQRLAEWAARAEASAAREEPGGREPALPPPVAQCVRGAWAALALAGVAREIWPVLGLPGSGSASLHGTARRLAEPWLRHVGLRMAARWAAQFDALYFQIPRALRADAAATRRDVVDAWLRAKSGSRPPAERYAALRQVCAARTGRSASPAVRRLAADVRAQTQAVAGLAPLAGVCDADMRRRVVGQAVAAAVRAACGPRVDAQAGGWDREQLDADIRFVAQAVGGEPAAFGALLQR